MRTITRMRQMLLAAFCTLFAVMMIVSCHREPLELYYTGKGELCVEPDWDTLFLNSNEERRRLTGMTVAFAKSEDPTIISPYPDITNTTDKYEAEFGPGKYNLLVFNLSPTEYGSMNFYQMKNFDDAFVVGQPLQRTTDFWDVNANYIKDPEYIGCAVDSFEVLPDMYDGELRFVDYRKKVGDIYDMIHKRVVVRPMTTEMVIRVKVIGFKYMKSVIGNISGMANGFELTKAWRRKQTAYQLLDNWTATPAPEESDSLHSVGYITTRINTFGLPRGRELLSQRDSTSNLLSLCFTLINDKQCLFTYPVGKDIKYKQAELNVSMGGSFSQADVTLELELLVITPFFQDGEVPNLPYAQPTGTGAFDAEVEDWGDDVNVDVPM